MNRQVSGHRSYIRTAIVIKCHPCTTAAVHASMQACMHQDRQRLSVLHASGSTKAVGLACIRIDKGCRSCMHQDRQRLSVLHASGSTKAVGLAVHILLCHFQGWLQLLSNPCQPLEMCGPCGGVAPCLHSRSTGAWTPVAPCLHSRSTRAG
jgi:hypothetical protein